jgi:hypothetical protein
MRLKKKKKHIGFVVNLSAKVKVNVCLTRMQLDLFLILHDCVSSTTWVIIIYLDFHCFITNIFILKKQIFYQYFINILLSHMMAKITRPGFSQNWGLLD